MPLPAIVPVIAMLLAAQDAPPAPPANPTPPDPPPPQVTTVLLPSDWSVGTRYAVELEKERREYEGEKQISHRRSRARIDVEIRERSEAGYVVRWTFGPTELLDGPAQVNPLVERMASLFDGVSMDFVTGPDGTPQTLVNEDDVRQRLEAVIEMIVKAMGDEGAPPAAVNTITGQMRQMMLGPQLGAIMLQDPGLYYLPSGGMFALGVRNAYEDQLPNPFGGEPFPSQAWFRLEELSERDGLAVVTWVQRVNPETQTRILRETMLRLAREMGRELPADDELPSFITIDEGRYEYDLISGLPRIAECSRTVAAANRRRVDRWRFKLLEYEPAE